MSDIDISMNHSQLKQLDAIAAYLCIGTVWVYCGMVPIGTVLKGAWRWMVSPGWASWGFSIAIVKFEELWERSCCRVTWLTLMPKTGPLASWCSESITGPPSCQVRLYLQLVLEGVRGWPKWAEVLHISISFRQGDK